MKEFQEYVCAAKKRQEPKTVSALKCCASCEELTPEGFCLAFHETPPADFIEKINDCEKYIQCIPF